MKSWNVHWCDTNDLFGGQIKVNAPNKREAEKSAIKMLFEKPYNFVIVAVEEAELRKKW